MRLIRPVVRSILKVQGQVWDQAQVVNEQASLYPGKVGVLYTLTLKIHVNR